MRSTVICSARALIRCRQEYQLSGKPYTIKTTGPSPSIATRRLIPLVSMVLKFGAGLTSLEEEILVGASFISLHPCVQKLFVLLRLIYVRRSLSRTEANARRLKFFSSAS